MLPSFPYLSFLSLYFELQPIILLGLDPWLTLARVRVARLLLLVRALAVGTAVLGRGAGALAGAAARAGPARPRACCPRGPGGPRAVDWREKGRKKENCRNE